MSVVAPISIDFRKPSNLTELAKFIGVDELLLEIACEPTKPDEIPTLNELMEGLQNGTYEQEDIDKLLFFKHLIPKRSAKRAGEYRVVWQARDLIADAYKSFSRRFELFVRGVDKRFPHASSFGYVRGRNTVDNAKGHCHASLILHADIQDFFPSISISKLKKMFDGLGLNEEVANLLSRFVTVGDALPLGLHASPLLANIVCLDLDDKLNQLAERYGCYYSRYADDISISGSSKVPTKDEVSAILIGEGFTLSERKFRITKLGQAHYVTGLSVTDLQPRAPRSMKKRLRQELYYSQKFGLKDHLKRINGQSDDYFRQGVNRIDGTVRYIASIEGAAWPELREKWKECLKDAHTSPGYETRVEREIRQIQFYVDETEIEFNGKKFLALALAQILTTDEEHVVASTWETLKSHLVDPFAGGNKAQLEKKKLHFVDANQDLKAAYIDKLSRMPFRSYLVFNELKSPDEYEKCYLSLLRSILPHRLMGADRDFATIIFEENSKVRATEIKETVEDVYNILKKMKNRRPVRVETFIGKKAHYPCFSVPDFLLGVFSHYACVNTKEHKERITLFFEKLRDKYRVILNAENNLVYSRKRPFLPWS